MVSLPVLQIPKPLYGEPCNGCGVCCESELCPAAKDIFGYDTKGPCPKLVWTDGRFQCGMVLDAKTDAERQYVLQAIGSIGMCDSVLNKADRIAARDHAKSLMLSGDHRKMIEGIELARILLH